MTGPINLQIRRVDNTWDIIEAAPFLREEGRDLIPTGVFQLYQGFPDFESNSHDMEALREKYMESLDLTGEDNPGYLGELHFTGVAFFEWKYQGHQLKESEVLQIVDCIQEHAAGNIPVSVNGVIIPKTELTEELPLTFKYGKNAVVSHVRLEEMEGHFVVLIDNEPIAQVELLEEDWEITGGDIYDPDLKEEVLRRIRANT